MNLKELKMIIKKMFTAEEICRNDEYEKALHQMLGMIEEEEEYRRKVDAMMGGGK